MTDPLTILFFAGAAAKGISMIGDFFSKRSEGAYANQLAQVNAQIMNRNAAISMRQAAMMTQLGAAQAAAFAAQAAAIQQIGAFNARNVRAIAAFEAEASRRETARLMGRQRAIYGASGVQPNSGSPLAVAEETAELGELDALMLLRNGEATAISILMDSAMQANALMASGAIAQMESAAGAFALRADATTTRWQAKNVLANGIYAENLANKQATINAIGDFGSFAASIGTSGFLSKRATSPVVGSSGGGGGPSVPKNFGGGAATRNRIANQARGSAGQFGSS